MACEAKNIYYLALWRKMMPAPGYTIILVCIVFILGYHQALVTATVCLFLFPFNR